MFDDSTGDKPSFNFDVATATIQGTRDYQQDSVLSNFSLGQTSGFAIVADGMGGSVAGHVASQIATSEVYTNLKVKEPELNNGTLDLPTVLRDAAETANRRIHERGLADDEVSGMGTTLLVPVIRGDHLSWLSIGDSPLLLFRGGALRQLNQDHSMAPQIDMMAKMGTLTPEAALNHPDRSTLTSALNGDDIAIIDCPVAPVTVQVDDIIIAASDGLQSLTNATIANTLMIARGGHAIDIANAFLAALTVRDAPDQDNASVVVIKLGAKTAKPAAVSIDDMPVLAMADSSPAQQPAAAAPAPEPEKDERKAYWYRGQKYYKD